MGWTGAAMTGAARGRGKVVLLDAVAGILGRRNVGPAVRITVAVCGILTIGWSDESQLR